MKHKDGHRDSMKASAQRADALKIEAFVLILKINFGSPIIFKLSSEIYLTGAIALLLVDWYGHTVQ